MERRIVSTEQAVEKYHRVMGGLKHRSDNLAPLYRGSGTIEELLDGSYAAQMEELAVRNAWKRQEESGHNDGLTSSSIHHRDNINLFDSSDSECSSEWSDGEEEEEEEEEGRDNGASSGSNRRVSRSKRHDTALFNIFACPEDADPLITKTRRVSYRSKMATDIDPIYLYNEMVKYKDNRKMRWEVLAYQFFEYSRSKYTLSVYCEVLNSELEAEMSLRTDSTYAFKDGAIVQNEESMITGWGHFQLLDYNTVEGRALGNEFSLIPALGNAECRDFMSMLDGDTIEETRSLYNLYEKYNAEDTFVVDHLELVRDNLLNTLAKAQICILSMACSKKSRKGQEVEMLHAASSRDVLNDIIEMKLLISSLRLDITGIEKPLIVPDKDWIWDIISRFDNPDMYVTVSAFDSISFQRSSQFVNDLSQCSILIFANFVRSSFLLHLNEYIKDTRTGRNFISLTHGTNYCKFVVDFCATEGLDNVVGSDGKAELAALEAKIKCYPDNYSILLKCGACPFLKKDAAITSLDLDTTMLSICELNSYFYECPYGKDLIDYTELLADRYACFSWFHYTDQRVMNSPAYVEATLIDVEDPETGETKQVMHKNVNSLFFRYGMLMLLPMMSEIEFWKGIECAFSVTLNTNDLRCTNNRIGFTLSLYERALCWFKGNEHNEIARNMVQTYKSQIIQFLLRPGETAMYKMKLPRSDPHPMIIINNLRPHDMDRYQEFILKGEHFSILHKNIFPYLSASSPLFKQEYRTGKSTKSAEISPVLARLRAIAVDSGITFGKFRTSLQDTYESKARESIESMLQIKDLDPEWAELIKVSKYYTEVPPPKPSEPIESSHPRTIDDLYLESSDDTAEDEDYFFVNQQHRTSQYSEESSATEEILGGWEDRSKRNEKSGHRDHGKKNPILPEGSKSYDSMDEDVLYGTKSAMDYFCSCIVKALIGEKEFGKNFFFRHDAATSIRQYFSVVFKQRFSNIYTQETVVRHLSMRGGKASQALFNMRKKKDLPREHCYQCCGGYVILSARMDVLVHCSNFIEAFYYWACIGLYSVMYIALREIAGDIEISTMRHMFPQIHGHSEDPSFAFERELSSLQILSQECVPCVIMSSITTLEIFEEVRVQYLLGIAEQLQLLLQKYREYLPKKWTAVHKDLPTIICILCNVFEINPILPISPESEGEEERETEEVEGLMEGETPWNGPIII